MTLPYIYYAAENDPSNNYILVTQPFMAGMVVNAPKNLRVETLDKKKIRNVVQLWGFTRQLHHRYEEAVIIDLHDVLRTKILRISLKLMGHDIYSLKKPRAERRKLLKKRDEERVPTELYLPRMTDLYRSVMQKAGVRSIQEEDYRIADGTLEKQVTIGIAPFAKHRGKMISKEQTIGLIGSLREKIPGCRLILYGAPGNETEANKEIAALFDENVRLTSAEGLREEVLEIARLHCMISMDSANQHIAAMVGTKVVSIWGATHPAAGFIPYNNDEDVCIGVDMKCRPCSIFGNKPCHRGDHACMERLDMNTVVTKVIDVIDR